MPGYTLPFVERLKRRCVCPLCRLPMKHPVKITACGHRFCDVCLQEYLSGGVFKCPEDDKPLDYAKIYHDPEVDSEIQNSLIRCKHYKDGCRWIDKLLSLQPHLDSCHINDTVCPNKCSVRLSRLSLSEHLEMSCPKRKVECDICGQLFPVMDLDGHRGNCQYELVWCENKCGAKLQRRYLNNHMKSECHKRNVSCQFCGKEFVQETLQTHQYQCPRYPVSCPNRCDPTKIPREEVEGHVQETCPSASVSCPFRDSGCKFKGPRFNLDKHLDESVKVHLKYVCEVVRKQQQQITHLCSALHTVTQVTEGTFIWRISDYKAKYIEAVYKNTQEITSQPFYTSRFGYKMAMSVFLNGNGHGKGKYLSIYIKLLPGEYDNILEWPFTLPISFSVFDQNSDPEKRATVMESFHPDSSWKHFQKPKKDVESLGFGYPKYVPLDLLKTRHYIKDDSIILKVKVDNQQFIVP